MKSFLKLSLKLSLSLLAFNLWPCLGAQAQSQAPVSVAAASTSAAPAAKKPAVAKETTGCRWKGGEFSQGAEFCVFSGRALLCENGVWKREDLTACVVTPAVLP